MQNVDEKKHVNLSYKSGKHKASVNTHFMSKWINVFSAKGYKQNLKQNNKDIQSVSVYLEHYKKIKVNGP